MSTLTSGTATTGGAAGATGSTTTATTGGTDGNTQLQAAFNQALASAQQTLSISTTGQADLNALRARPQ